MKICENYAAGIYADIENRLRVPAKTARRNEKTSRGNENFEGRLDEHWYKESCLERMHKESRLNTPPPELKTRAALVAPNFSKTAKSAGNSPEMSVTAMLGNKSEKKDDDSETDEQLKKGDETLPGVNVPSGGQNIASDGQKDVELPSWPDVFSDEQNIASDGRENGEFTDWLNYSTFGEQKDAVNPNGNGATAVDSPDEKILLIRSRLFIGKGFGIEQSGIGPVASSPCRYASKKPSKGKDSY
jgi:hypothetical protein